MIDYLKSEPQWRPDDSERKATKSQRLSDDAATPESEMSIQRGDRYNMTSKFDGRYVKAEPQHNSDTASGIRLIKSAETHALKMRTLFYEQNGRSFSAFEDYCTRTLSTDSIMQSSWNEYDPALTMLHGSHAQVLSYIGRPTKFVKEALGQALGEVMSTDRKYRRYKRASRWSYRLYRCLLDKDRKDAAEIFGVWDLYIGAVSTLTDRYEDTLKVFYLNLKEPLARYPRLDADASPRWEALVQKSLCQRFGVQVKLNVVQQALSEDCDTRRKVKCDQDVRLASQTHSGSPQPKTFCPLSVAPLHIVPAEGANVPCPSIHSHNNTDLAQDHVQAESGLVSTFTKPPPTLNSIYVNFVVEHMRKR